MSADEQEVKREGRSRFSFRYFGEVWAELKKVTWLNRREVAYLTGIVIIVVVIVGVIFGFLDLGFTNLIDKFLIGIS
jgi:preprotein translocase subunit SecE